MALGDLVALNSGCKDSNNNSDSNSGNSINMASSQMGARFSFSSTPNHFDEIASRRTQGDDAADVAVGVYSRRESGGSSTSGSTSTSIVYLPQSVYFCDWRHDAFEASVPSGPSESGLVSKWRMKDRMKTGYVALVLCLNIGVDPPDVIKISPCARMECWIDPFSMVAPEALDAIGKTLQAQYERWQPRARYKLQLDPTVEEVKKLCRHCHKSAKSERVLFHYNGHGAPKPTANGEIWIFNKSYTQYILLYVYELESWLGFSNPNVPTLLKLHTISSSAQIQYSDERPPLNSRN